MKGKKTTARTGKTKAARKGKGTIAKTARSKAVKKVKRAKKAKTAADEQSEASVAVADATVIRESSAPPAVIVSAELQSPGMISEGLVSKILDREQDQRDMLWKMAEEMSRLGGAIQHQHHILTDLVQHILQHPDRQLPSGATVDESPQAASPVAPLPASAESVPPNENTATGADADATLVSQEELLQLRDALAQEQELVERLRGSKPEIGSAATGADADAAPVSQEELQQLQDALVQEQELVDRLRRPNAEGKSAATEADPNTTLVPQDELLQLRDALVQEEALVERLRRSKLKLERRAVAAEAALDNRKSFWTRLLGRNGET